MSEVPDIIPLLDKSIRTEDKQLCYFLLIERFDARKKDFSQIYDILSLQNSHEEAINLIFAALHHINIFVHHLDHLCPTQAAKNLPKFSKQRWFFIMVYKELRNEEITKFFRCVIKKTLLDPTCLSYLDCLSQTKIIFDDGFKNQVNKFSDQINVPTLKKYLQEVDNGIEFDGKRRRMCLTGHYEAPREDISQPTRYPIKRDRENLCLVYCDPERPECKFISEKIRDTFGKIKGFHVKIESEVVTPEDIMSSLSDNAKRISAKSDMFVCFLMTNSSVHREKIITTFRTENVPNLGGKPKIFFSNYCYDSENIKVAATEVSGSGGGNEEFDCAGGPRVSPNSHPSIGDYLFFASKYVPSSAHDCNNEGGTISRICDAIKEHFATESLQVIMEIVSKEMILDKTYCCRKQLIFLE